MITKKTTPFALVLLALLLTTCRPGGAYYVDELDIVGTAYTKDIDFKSRKTYAMWDTIVQLNSDDINDPDGNGRPDYIPQSSANIITAQIDKSLSSLGWTRVDKNQNPDVYIQNAAMENTYVYYYYSYWYYGWYYPYGGWYYPGYYPPSYSTTQTGTLLMMMMDTKEVSPAGKAPVLWMGVINGMMEGSTASFQSRVSKSVDQAFKQSPILKR